MRKLTQDEFNAQLKSGDKNFSNLDLSGLDMSNADMSYSDMSYSDMAGAVMFSADMRCADMRYADMSCAVMRYADMSCADMSCADMSYADMHGAVMFDANITNAKLPAYQVCPEKGSFIAYKKASKHVVKLEIPAEARRTSSLTRRKCRAEFAKVLGIYGLDGELTELTKIKSNRRWPSLIYRVGEIAKPDSYNDDIRLEHTNGIHFFMTFEDAKDW